MKRWQRGLGLPELWLALGLALLLWLALLQLQAGLLRSARVQQQLSALQQQEQTAWQAIESSLLQLGGSELPALRPGWAAGQALAAGLHGHAGLALQLRQRQAPGAAASGCLGGTHPARLAGDWSVVDMFYVSAGALLCQSLAYRVDDSGLITPDQAQALLGGAADPVVQGWDLQWGVAAAGGALQYRPALPLPDWRSLRSLRVTLQLREPDGRSRFVSRLFVLPP